MKKKEKKVYQEHQKECLQRRCYNKDDLLPEPDGTFESGGWLKGLRRVKRMKSYRQYLLSALFVIVVLAGISGDCVKAQTVQNLFAAPYGNLGVHYVPSGLLHNQSPYYPYCFRFDTVSWQNVPDTVYKASPYLYGIGQIMMQKGHFLRLYRDMLFSRLHDTVLVNPVGYNASLASACSAYQVPLSLMAVVFDRMKEDALISRHLWFDTLSGTFGPMPDTLWCPDTLLVEDTAYYGDSTCFEVFANPDSLMTLSFEQHWVFAADVPDDVVLCRGNTLTVRYGLPSGLFVTNTKSLPSVMIDFDNGQGFSLVPWDTPVDITYPWVSSATVHEVVLKIRIPTLNPDAEISLKVNLVKETKTSDTVFSTSVLPQPCLSSLPHTPAEGKVSILYADPNDQRLKKPVVFIEGFESSSEPYGVISFQNVMNGVMPLKGYQELAELPLLFDSLSRLGYDLVYLDFLNARDTIERNMLTVVRTLEWVNAQLVLSGSTEKLVVAGASMGGLLARYALRIMELEGCCHNTRLYISFDAPHQGANIPLGMQKFVEVAADASRNWKSVSWPLSWIAAFRGLEINLHDPDTEEAWSDVLNSPAARAMLIQHVDASAATEHALFYGILDSLGLPQYCRNIALINGSEIGMAHMLEDPQQRLLGTGITQKLPAEWVVTPWGFNVLNAVHWFPVNFSPYTMAYSTAWAESQPAYFENNPWEASINGVNNILRAAMLHSSIHAALGITAGLSVVTNPLVALLCEAAIVTSKGSGNAKLDDAHDLASTVQSYSVPGMVNLTCAPGGLNNSLQRLGASGDGIVSSYSKAFSFIPSVSALYARGYGYGTPVQYHYLMDPASVTPFDAYWAPDRDVEGQLPDVNQRHVMITGSNRNWIVEQVLKDWEMKDAGLYAGNLWNSFNYGKPALSGNIIASNKPYNNILYSLDVQAGGVLSVNKQGVIGFQGGSYITQPSSTLVLHSNGDPCDNTQIRVFDGGSFELGDPSNFNRAIVYIHRNSTLELFPGSTLLVNQNSLLIIEKGATLIMHPGANIILNGSEAVLEMRGRLVLSDYAQFAIQGSGYLRYNAPIDAANQTDFFQIGEQASLILEGNGQTKKLEVIQDTWFPESLRVKCLDVKVYLAENTNLILQGETVLESSWFLSTDTLNSYYGAVVLCGQKEASVDYCTFSSGTYGLKANLGIGGNPLFINGCHFRNNIFGLNTTDERVWLKECTLSGNAQDGWLAENMAGKSLAEGSIFQQNGNAGVCFDGQLSSSLLLRECLLEENETGISIAHAMLQAECSRFKDNSSAGILGGLLSRIQLDETARNRITGNPLGIALNQALSVNLENSFAGFSGNQYYIAGELLPDLFYDAQTSIATSLDISGNYMPANQSQVPVYVWFSHPVTQLPVQVGIVCQTMVPFEQTVCYFQKPVNEHIVLPILSKTGAAAIQGGKYHQYLLLDALYDAASKVSCDGFAGNDTLAVSCFNEIFSHLPGSLGEGEKAAVDYSLELMNGALCLAVEAGWVEPNRAIDNMPVDEYVAMVRDLIGQKINQIGGVTPEAKEKEARYQLMMAQLYRVAEHYDYAMDILEETTQFSGTSLSGSAVYWDCVCKAEKEMLSGNLDKNIFQQRMDSCNQMYNARMRPFIPVTGNSELIRQADPANLVESVYPNPADQVVVVKFHSSVKNIYVELQDSYGKLICSYEKEHPGSSFSVSIPEVSTGVYILKINAEGNSSMHKVIVNQQ